MSSKLQKMYCDECVPLKKHKSFWTKYNNAMAAHMIEFKVKMFGDVCEHK